jgi:predicted ATP-grasp superfamily ATP-dependent carboligase
MRVLLYEWCVSGGLAGPDAKVLVPPHASAADLEPLAHEGRSMLLALIHDGMRAGNLELHAIVDATRPLALPARVKVHEVAAAEELQTLAAAAGWCEAAIIVAPETGGILAGRVAVARAAGADVIACGPAFLAMAADKQATVLALTAAGVPVPAGRRLEAGAAWPEAFLRPAVGKRIDGVGCVGLVRVGPEEAFPPPTDYPLRIEAAVTGLPVGVACLVAAGRIDPLPPMIQQFSAGDAPGYLGGEPLVCPVRRDRAERLARRSIAALERATGEPARGWVGVDMILGEREDGRDDRVLEVNPRLTTSVVGHASAARESLLDRLVSETAGDPASQPVPRSFRLPDAFH